MAQPFFDEGAPAPIRDPFDLDAPFWRAAADNRLVIQRCSDCRTWRWGPEWVCHVCHSLKFAYEEVRAEGRLYSWSRAWHAPLPALNAATPYLVGIVELHHAGNVRIVGNLLDNPETSPVIGSQLDAVFERHGGQSPGDPYGLIHWKVK